MADKQIFTLEALRARNGDCLLLHYGNKTDQKMCLIDGGPSRVYQPSLRLRLKEIKKKRNLSEYQSLPIELLMISHIDDDHINGILEMTMDLINAKDDHRPLYVDVQNLWHNSFDEIIGNKPEDLVAAITAGFGEAALGGHISPDHGLGHDASMVLASVGQGHRLRNDARRLGWRVNSPFTELVMMRGKLESKVDKFEPVKMTIVGPSRKELLALQKKYDAFLKEKGIGRSQGEAALAAFKDSSVPNLSSIVVLVEVCGKTILLTGDARGDKILEGLAELELLEGSAPLKLDILKMPHHGSDRNVAPEFFEKIIADHYVFCGDGKHGNPERETMRMLFEARPEGGFELHFTYPIKKIDKTRKKEWERKHIWVDSQHSLQSFFDEKAKDTIFRIIEPVGKKSIKIDLLEAYPH